MNLSNPQAQATSQVSDASVGGDKNGESAAVSQMTAESPVANSDAMTLTQAQSQAGPQLDASQLMTLMQSIVAELSELRATRTPQATSAAQPIKTVSSAPQEAPVQVADSNQEVDASEKLSKSVSKGLTDMAYMQACQHLGIDPSDKGSRMFAYPTMKGGALYIGGLPYSEALPELKATLSKLRSPTQLPDQQNTQQQPAQQNRQPLKFAIPVRQETEGWPTNQHELGQLLRELLAAGR